LTAVALGLYIGQPQIDRFYGGDFQVGHGIEYLKGSIVELAMNARKANRIIGEAISMTFNDRTVHLLRFSARQRGTA
jgi:hypothetical protein